MKYRTYVGCASPLHFNMLQLRLGVIKTCRVFRDKYKKNFEIAKDILGITRPRRHFIYG
jgi:hypothetical protein